MKKLAKVQMKQIFPVKLNIAAIVLIAIFALEVLRLILKRTVMSNSLSKAAMG